MQKVDTTHGQPEADKKVDAPVAKEVVVATSDTHLVEAKIDSSLDSRGDDLPDFFTYRPSIIELHNVHDANKLAGAPKPSFAMLYHPECPYSQHFKVPF